MATTGEPLFEEVSAANNEVTVGHPSPEALRATRTVSPKYRGWNCEAPEKCPLKWLPASVSLMQLSRPHCAPTPTEQRWVPPLA